MLEMGWDDKLGWKEGTSLEGVMDMSKGEGRDRLDKGMDG